MCTSIKIKYPRKISYTTSQHPNGAPQISCSRNLEIYTSSQLPAQEPLFYSCITSCLWTINWSLPLYPLSGQSIHSLYLCFSLFHSSVSPLTLFNVNIILIPPFLVVQNHSSPTVVLKASLPAGPSVFGLGPFLIVVLFLSSERSCNKAKLFSSGIISF